MLILFATQTGNSEYYAEELARQVRSTSSMEIRVQSVQDYDFIKLPQEPLVAFLVSTTGDGEIPTSMVTFWRFLLIKDLPTDSLSKVKFTLFGLGDSSYSKFNYAGRKLRSRLLQLSAAEFIKSAFGDEMHPCGIETEYTQWQQNVLQYCNLNSPLLAIQLKKDQENFIDTQVRVVEGEVTQKLAASKPKVLRFAGKRMLTSPDNQDKRTYQFNFHFQQNEVYKCGDILMIKPQNDARLVQNVLDLLEYDPEQTIRIDIQANMSKQNRIPKILTIRALLTNFLDLTSPPNRYFIRVLSWFAKEEIHKSKLKEMCSNSNEGQEDYYSYVYREKRNVYEVLFDFQPCKMPVHYLIDGLRPIRQREYSISSYQITDSVSITVAMVEYKTAKNRLIRGFCSSFLENLVEGQLVEYGIQRGSVGFPADPEVPTIMVGPGTGVAPFIGFLQQRAEQWKQKAPSKSHTILFFGSRYRASEFYYQDFLNLQSENMVLITAFSRDQDEKIYVQARIRENAQLIRATVTEHLHSVKIYVCGTSRKMPQQVEQAFQDVLGAAVLGELKRRSQYIVECW